MHIPDANVSTFSKESGVYDMKLEAVFREVRVKGPQWVSGNLGDDPFGNSTNGPAATLSITITKTRGWKGFSRVEYSVIDVDACLLNAQYILMKDYLAVLIGYCTSSEWKLSNQLSGPEHCEGDTTVIDPNVTACSVKLEVLDSDILRPSTARIDELVLPHIPSFSVSFTPSVVSEMSNTTWASAATEVNMVQMKCKKLALLLQGFHRSLKSSGDSQERLIERIDCEMTMICFRVVGNGRGRGFGHCSRN